MTIAENTLFLLLLRLIYFQIIMLPSRYQGEGGIKRYAVCLSHAHRAKTVRFRHMVINIIPTPIGNPILEVEPTGQVAETALTLKNLRPQYLHDEDR